MPIITVSMGEASEEQKKKLVQNLTREAAEITQKDPNHFTVFIHEYPYENIGQGGKTIKEMRG